MDDLVAKDADRLVAFMNKQPPEYAFGAVLFEQIGMRPMFTLQNVRETLMAWRSRKDVICKDTSKKAAREEFVKFVDNHARNVLSAAKARENAVSDAGTSSDVVTTPAPVATFDMEMYVDILKRLHA